VSNNEQIFGGGHNRLYGIKRPAATPIEDLRHLTLTRAEDRGVHVLTVSGNVDDVVESTFRDALATAVAGANSPLILDLTGVTYIDSNGLGALIRTQRQMNARPDKLYLVVCDPRTRRTFSALGLNKLFDLYETLKAATAAALKELCEPPRA
jgi:anti-sigma B factor antagonist